MRRLIALLTLILSVAALPGLCQDRAADVKLAFTRAQHLKRGINMMGWFTQSNDYSAKHTSLYTDDRDIELIAHLGFDNIRLCFDPTPFEKAPLNEDGLNADFVGRLDHAMDTMIANGLAVQLDMHASHEYEKQLRNGPDVVDNYVYLWRKIAAHYATRDPNMVFFEMLNEPEQDDAYRWAGMQDRVAQAIRQVAPHHTLIAAGNHGSGIYDLMSLQPLADGNVIYNFHFYTPLEFTHQGATWAKPWFRYTHDIPYPANENDIKPYLSEVPDANARFLLEEYGLSHWDAHHIQVQIDEAADWGKANNVPLICNEFGVFRTKSNPVSRNAWIHDVRTALEADGIGWAMWDYRNTFGLVLKEDGKPAVPDPLTVKALGLKM